MLWAILIYALYLTKVYNFDLFSKLLSGDNNKLSSYIASIAPILPLLSLISWPNYRCATLLARFAIAEAKTKSLSSGLSERRMSSLVPSHHLLPSWM